ncbi:hypothetical protein BCF11_1824 [Collimonas sp. PA-H2]|uniref:hypothetical protein n=1 Tax=Collimonas sp. PA-H2 TaxID=1881062 RepID=UPI000BF4CA73|nr:hypothetical protein [Collimonas sp. PA-H2]PFH09428.1 hypothetical protein BCF11_1824 [Collimonas sp. PA-H2]
MKKNLAALGQVTILLGAGMAHAAHASGGELWVGPVAMICMVQDPANQKTSMGVSLLAVPQFQEQVAAMGRARACIVRKHLLSNELCSAVLTNDSKMTQSRIEELYEKHASEIQGIQNLAECEVDSAK